MKTLVFSLLICFSVFAQGPDYPAPTFGHKRVVVLRFTESRHSPNFTIEFTKKSKSGCNRGTIFQASLEKRTLAGWGYTYFVLTDVTGPFTFNRMACNLRGVEYPFSIQFEEKSEHHRGNYDRVLYIPKNVQATYQIWTASEDMEIPEL